MTKWLTIIGMGEEGYEGLGALARAKLAEAEIIVGSSRLLAFMPQIKAKRVEWPQPFAAVVDRIKTLPVKVVFFVGSNQKSVSVDLFRKACAMPGLRRTAIRARPSHGRSAPMRVHAARGARGERVNEEVARNLPRRSGGSP